MRIAILLLTISILNGQGPSFKSHFTGLTMRVDYQHSGIATQEHYALEQIKVEGEWPGRRTELAPKSTLGPYRFEINNAATGALLFAEGFASIYGEWETTQEAADGIWRSFSETLRFPEPRRPVKLTIRKRDAGNRFRQVYQVAIDPGSRQVNRARITPRGKVWVLFENGPPAVKVDILVLGDGYRKKDRRLFHLDVRQLMERLFSTEPFRSRKNDFNVRAIDLPAAQAGVSRPRSGVWRDSPLALSYNALDSERYMLTYANTAVRDIAAQAPYDAIIMIANSDKYGGGGIYNLYATSAAHNEQSAYVVIHEFGHSFAGLGDEYYSSSVAYLSFDAKGVEPWAPNITALLNPELLKWRAYADKSTPLPTPWDQAAYDTLANEYQRRRVALRSAGAPESDLEALFKEQQERLDPLLAAEPYFGKVGAFEGAQYQGQGLYRPEANCIMFTRYSRFCQVCSRTIEQRIDSYIR